MASNPPGDRERGATGRASGTGDKSNTFPRRESSGDETGGLTKSLTKSSASINTMEGSDIDPSELFRPTRAPVRATRPQSYAPSYTRSAKSLPSLQTSTTPHLESRTSTSRTCPPQETIREEEEETPPVSAPPSQSSKRWWNRPSHPTTPTRHHSVSTGPSYSFVSYIDGPIRSSTQTQQVFMQCCHDNC